MTQDNSTAQLLPCPTPFCAVPEPFVERVGSHLFKARCKYCNVETEAHLNEAAAIVQWNTRTPVSQDAAQLVDALDDLQQAEAEYRLMHDRHGDGSQAAGRAWDLMRRAGDKAREALTRVQPSGVISASAVSAPSRLPRE